MFAGHSPRGPYYRPFMAHCLIAGPTRCPVATGGALSTGVSPSTFGGARPQRSSRIWPVTDVPWVDAWYLDGFAPATETGPWESSVYEAMASLSRPGATFATFTAASTVRHGLADAGFHVIKRTGYGRKREALCGHLDTASPRPPLLTPWDLNAHPISVDNALGRGCRISRRACSGGTRGARYHRDRTRGRRNGDRGLE